MKNKNIKSRKKVLQKLAFEAQQTMPTALGPNLPIQFSPEQLEEEVGTVTKDMGLETPTIGDQQDSLEDLFAFAQEEFKNLFAEVVEEIVTDESIGDQLMQELGVNTEN